MKLAIIGSGISGLVCAYLLYRWHEITVFEANTYIGGHTHTIPVETPAGTVNVDTGFIVYNEKCYPNFIKLITRLNVATQPTEMSFSVRCDRTGLEYASSGLNKLFAQRRNLLRPSFYRMLLDILRFNREGKTLLKEEGQETTLGELLRAGGYSKNFIEHHFLPLAGSVWSTNLKDMQEFPARYLLQFFENHGFLDVHNRPKWRVITGGSNQYIAPLTAGFGQRIRLNAPVRSVRRTPEGVQIETQSGGVEHYEQVIFATHSDQSLRILSDPSEEERNILSAIRYQENDAVLHTDTNLLPRCRRAWASWNYHLLNDPPERPTVTYNMNILQSLKTRETYCVTLNRTAAIAPEKIIKRICYHHPLYTPAAVAAQKRHSEISGVRNTHFCGAYWGFGFHEDGVNSALKVCASFGAALE